jgi:ABC-type transport system involved in cytochrome c biogenesis permease subunit
LYLIAFVFTILTWFGGPAARPLNRTAFALIAFTLVVHTWAIWARMAISGRPPVTNLYTTAIFIGWATVLFGLVFEGMYKIGVGNVLASVTGWATLLIAHGIAGDGDTFTVLQAVLDTQFWLATHVVTINLGYATTFVSGTLGILYVLRGLFTPSLTPEIGKSIARMIYGTLCFGMFFSFVGTVLGGLWGDDSWGRFWGWDPKENGALMIVLWTALVLHARWDGMVKDRGLAVLAIGGNIWTAWSWFGVNQLGVGLHSYGSTEGTLQKLGLFVLSQFIIIGLGMLPKSCWWSFCVNKERQAITKLDKRA